MNCIGKMAVCLASVLALNASLRADDVVLPGNPYAPVVARNVFGLNPVTVVDTTPVPPEPPVKITPNGIMTIFGQMQVLFKTSSPPKAGKPAVEQSYILSEGQRQDDIEVTRIDEKKSLITFDNHGLIQELPLADASAASAGSPASGIHPVNRLPTPTMPGRMGNRFGGRGNFGGRFPANNPGAGSNPNVSNNSNMGSVPGQSNYSGQQQQPQQQMTPEEQAIIIEAQQQYYKQQGSPIANLFPPPPAALKSLMKGTSPPMPPAP